MKRKTTFGGVVLDDTVPGFKTLSVSGRQFHSAKIESSENVTDGSDFISKRIPERELTVAFMLKPSGVTLQEAQEMLLAVLNTSEPAQLIFSDEPGVYFNAIYQEAKISEEHAKVRSGTLTFICLDPFKHSTTVKEFTAVENSDGVLTATIVNDGTVDVPITYEITHMTDNGYIGIVSEKGAMQYGLPEEEDGHTYTKSERLMTMDTVYNAADDASGTACAMASDFTVNATMSKTYIDGGYYLSPSLKKTGSSWNGAQRTITIPADSEGNTGSVNFYLYMKEWFRCQNPNELGCQFVSVLDANNKVICGIQMYTPSPGTNLARYKMWANGKIIDAETFQPDNSSGNCFNQTNGNNCIRKQGDQLTFYFWGYHSFVVPELASVEAAKIQISLGGFASYNYMARNCIGAFTFDKLHVDAYQDDPNRYGAGDVVKVDGDEGKIYVNGLARMSDEVRGTKYFKASPGENVVEFYNSTWITQNPTIKAYIREAYL